MVKGFDPSENDFAKKVVDHLLGAFRSQSIFSIETAEFYIKDWLKKPSYIKVYEELKSTSGTFPKLRLKQSCWNLNSLASFIPSKSDKNFPAYTVDETNSIVICLNQIRNKLELKQNLDRQLHYLHHFRSHMEDPVDKDHRKIQAIYAGCLESYRNYQFSLEIRKTMAMKCTKYLFWKRTDSTLPYDALFRYTSKLLEYENEGKGKVSVDMLRHIFSSLILRKYHQNNHNFAIFI